MSACCSGRLLTAAAAAPSRRQQRSSVAAAADVVAANRWQNVLRSAGSMRQRRLGGSRSLGELPAPSSQCLQHESNRSSQLVVWGCDCVCKPSLFCSLDHTAGTQVLALDAAFPFDREAQLRKQHSQQSRCAGRWLHDAYASSLQQRPPVCTAILAHP